MRVGCSRAQLLDDQIAIGVDADVGGDIQRALDDLDEDDEVAVAMEAWEQASAELAAANEPAGDRDLAEVDLPPQTV